jgi:hypothetical protein
MILPLLAVAFINHLPFPVTQPVTIGDKTYFAETPTRQLLIARPDKDGLRLAYSTTELGRLSFSLTVQPAGDKRHPAAQFLPLPLDFRRVTGTALYTDYQAEAQRSGMSITVTERVFPSGFLDTRISLRNVSARQVDGMYAAVSERWEHPAFKGHQLCYDNRDMDFDAGGKTRFSAGKERYWALQHGIDWLALNFDRANALLLSSYSESPTTLDDTHLPRRKSPRFTGLNIPQFKNEAQTVGNSLYLVTEFVRENHTYADRFIDKRLPAPGQVLTNESRVIFSDTVPSHTQAEQEFLAYNAYAKINGETVEIGVPSTVFGTSYFPYSTLGENFGALKLPGQQTDAYWPLSADTVTHWRDFAGDIRRDLRIAKAMGFTEIRLHYVDVLARLPEKLQYEYLDFLFGEIRHLKLRVLFSTAFPYWTPEEIAARVGRYKDVIDRLEIENETLIWGIPLDRPQYWSRVYHAVKEVAPNVQIHWTSHVNSGIFSRMEDLHLHSDVISAHAYIDGQDAIPSGRGFALAIGSYARRAGKPAIFTEWDWRKLTRMSADQRAKIYAPVFESLLATHSIAEVYQFQFQESLSVNPHTRKGIRHYELLWLSRRPKPEAFELMKLMDRYAAPDTPNRQIGANHPVVDGGRGTAKFHLENQTSRPMTLHVSVEADPAVKTELPLLSLHLAAHEAADVPVRLTLPPNSAPGFYHVFLRLERMDGLVRYGWAELRKSGQPAGAMINLDRPINVVYAKDAPIIDVEAAYLLAQTAEAASGRPVGLYSEEDLPKDGQAVIHVTNYEHTVKLVLSYWLHAKDSAARKIGLVEKKLPPGVDVANLP